jgi:hypothetical protein
MIVGRGGGGLHTGQSEIPRVQLGGKVLILVQLLLQYGLGLPSLLQILRLKLLIRSHGVRVGLLDPLE